MAKRSENRIVDVLLTRYGRTFADELGIDVARNSPSALFRLLCMALLLSARIRGDIAMNAARALSKQGWTTAQKMAGAGWERRTKVLNESGYARYDERTSAMLGDTADRLVERYGGDLRKLRDEAGRDPGRERALLKQFKGIGDTGVDVFFREVQVAWDEVGPFADTRALHAAGKLGLDGDADSLAAMTGGRDRARLIAALVRVDLERAYDGVLQEASA